MADSLREQARAMLIDERTGLVSQVERVDWADGMIAALDDVPDFLISMSLNETLDREDRLDLVQYPIRDDDCTGFAGRLVHALENGRISFDRAAEAGHAMAMLSDEADNGLYDFFWISEELILARDGAVEEDVIHRYIIDRLKKIAG